MEFDKNRIYTAVNADELPIGSRCLFADTIRGLRRKVGEEKDTNCAETFYRLHNDGGDDLFVGNDCAYCYAYLIEPPAEPKYKPFESIDKALEVIKKHGGYLQYKDSKFCILITAYDSRYLYSNFEQITLKRLSDEFCFADDGSPCGELVEE